MPTLRLIAWIACVVYSTIPAFWLLIHPRAEYWRTRRSSPYKILLPLWIATWAAVATITFPWRSLLLFSTPWTSVPAILLLCSGLLLYKLSHHSFTLSQLGGLPELRPGFHPQKLATSGIRAHVRHPVYLGHLCEMLAWSLFSGLAVCWALTAFAIVTGTVMIRMEDKELESRFGVEYRRYRSTVPAVLPTLRPQRPLR